MGARRGSFAVRRGRGSLVGDGGRTGEGRKGYFDRLDPSFGGGEMMNRSDGNGVVLVSRSVVNPSAAFATKAERSFFDPQEQKTHESASPPTSEVEAVPTDYFMPPPRGYTKQPEGHVKPEGKDLVAPQRCG